MGRDTLDSIRKLKELKAAREASGKKVSEHIQPVLVSTAKPKLSIKARLMSTVILTILRHTLSTIGGAAGLNGIATDNEYSLIAGALMTAGTVIWSLYSKKKEAAKAK